MFLLNEKRLEAMYASSCLWHAFVSYGKEKEKKLVDEWDKVRKMLSEFFSKCPLSLFKTVMHNTLTHLTK